MARPAPTFAPDSPLVTVVRPGLGYLRGNLLPRVGAPVCTVIHTTGGGILTRFEREGRKKGDADAFATAVRTYATVMPASGHYVVGQGADQIAQVVPEALCAWHVGGAGSAPYQRLGTSWMPRSGRQRYAWWQEKWAGLDGPGDLAGGALWEPYVIGPSLAQRLRHPLSWGKGSVNAWAVGIEVVPPEGDPRGEWSPECWRSLARLVPDIHERNTIPLKRDHAISHSDAHPLSRTTPRGEPWDTVAEQWSWERFEREQAE